MSRFNDPKAAFEAENDDHAGQQSRALSMLSGSGGEAGFTDGEGPLGTGGGKEGRNVLSHTSLLIVLVALVAAGSLYAMRLLQSDRVTTSKDDSAIVAKLDNWLTKADAGSFSADDATNPANIKNLMNDTEQVLRVLNIDASEHQVPIEYVKQNPFTFHLGAAEDETGPVYDPAMADRAAAQRRRQLEMELSKYRIDSIMMGKRNVVMVNGQMLQAGDHLGEFVIEEIQSMQVLLRNGQERFTLTINMDESAKPRR